MSKMTTEEEADVQRELALLQSQEVCNLLFMTFPVRWIWSSPPALNLRRHASRSRIRHPLSFRRFPPLVFRKTPSHNLVGLPQVSVFFSYLYWFATLMSPSAWASDSPKPNSRGETSYTSLVAIVGSSAHRTTTFTLLLRSFAIYFALYELVITIISFDKYHVVMSRTHYFSPYWLDDISSFLALYVYVWTLATLQAQFPFQCVPQSVGEVIW